MPGEERREPLHAERVDARGDEEQRQRDEVEVRGVEHGDDDDRDQVVHHGQRQQEQPQGAGQVGADDRQHRHREGDVGRGRNGPALQAVGSGEVDQRVQQRGDGHARRGGDHGHHRFGRLAQIAGDKLVLQLQPDQEEEHRQQAVGRPRAEAEVQVERLGSDGEVTQAEVGGRRRGVGPDQGDDGRGDQQQAAGGFAAENLADAQRLGVAGAGEDTAGQGGHQRPFGSSVRDFADQTSRRTGVEFTARGVPD